MHYRDESNPALSATQEWLFYKDFSSADHEPRGPLTPLERQASAEAMVGIATYSIKYAMLLSVFFVCHALVTKTDFIADVAALF